MGFKCVRLFVAVAFCAVGGFAQQALTVEKLVQFITSSISQKMTDSEVAKFLSTVKMAERLDPRVIEDLQGKGAGSRTVAALTKLADASATLSAPAPKLAAPKPTPIPAPPYSEQYELITEVREYAVNYSRMLPDFISLQVTRRYQDRNFKPGSEGSWSQMDRVAARLSFFEQQEKYELLSDNDTPMIGKTFESLGGTISRGEFGSTLKEIFDPKTAAELHWVRWGTLRGQLCHVISYSVSQSHSTETIDYQRGEATATPAYHGLVYVPRGTHEIVRLTVEPEMPAGFPIQEVHQTIDYLTSDISGQKFLLPARSDLVMRHDRDGTRNEIEFRGYRKYSADTSIKFDDSGDDSGPEDAKEQPASALPAR